MCVYVCVMCECMCVFVPVLRIIGCVNVYVCLCMYVCMCFYRERCVCYNTCIYIYTHVCDVYIYTYMCMPVRVCECIICESWVIVWCLLCICVYVCTRE